MRDGKNVDSILIMTCDTEKHIKTRDAIFDSVGTTSAYIIKLKSARKVMENNFKDDNQSNL